MISAGIAVAMSVLLIAATAQAQPASDPQATTEKLQVEELQRQSREAYETGSWLRFYIANMKLHQLHAFEPEYMVNIVRACALLDRSSTAYHFMLKMQQQGMSYDFNTLEDTLNIRGTEAYDYINDLLVSAGHASGVATELFTLPGSPGDFRAMAWDDSRKKFLVGTVRDGSISAISVNGESEVVFEGGADNGLWSVDGLAVDTENGRLWVASGATDEYSGPTPADNNLGALFELDLETLAIEGRYNFPVDGLKHEPGSIAVTDDGHVYVINKVAPVIYLKTPDSDELVAFFASKDLTGLRDIAVAPDNSRIFVADAIKGVMIIDPVAQQAAMLAGPETMNLGGIDGLEYSGGRLFLVQGQFQPQRVIRLELDGTGAQVQSISPMANALEQFKRPGITTVMDNDLVYFANTAAVDAPAIMAMSTPLDSGAKVAPPDMSQFEEAIRARQQQEKE
jgi:hypothetical protein